MPCLSCLRPLSCLDSTTPHRSSAGKPLTADASEEDHGGTTIVREDVVVDDDDEESRASRRKGPPNYTTLSADAVSGTMTAKRS
ncbi:hypothetical protein SNOG_16326 [Parastagonospora nodorum SN15]|uniref:Uncharacterized protein n=1 Tax=Phaeosphaeria nodorum (strain SN15 / ATCC MYA-4574 / FGSC 10173) TaxID=321614 RepID=Q0TW03_PHANO|nr:hypothetical protein SNOG_16326 [Parastagonospora nodorum SN15]EAT76312.1 hypothetical protein SNOG_16326 [Parastagonospora nodorum SN15]